MNLEDVKTEEEKNEVKTEANTSEQSHAHTDPPPKKNRRIKSPAGAGVMCAILFVILYIIVNISAFTGIFSTISTVLTPVLLGCAFAYILNPVLKLFEHKVFHKIKNTHVVRGLSVLMTYVSVILLLVAIGFLIIPQLVDSIVRFVNGFDGYFSQTIETINDFINEIAGRPGAKDLIDKDAVMKSITDFISKSGDLVSTIVSYVIEYGTGLIVGIKNFILGIFISIYILLAKERLQAQIKKGTTALFTPAGKGRFYRYARLCNRTFGGFFAGKILNSLIIGVITLIVLLIARMPYALLVSTIVCITDIIPIFGPIIGAIPSFFIIFIVDPIKAFVFLILVLLIQQLDGNVIGPKILGESTNISSLGVIVAIVIMGDMFGVIGMIVGVPIFSVVIALVKEFVETRLKKKSLSTDTADYYARDALVDPNEVHENIWVRVTNNMINLFKKILALIKRIINRLRKKNSENNMEHTNVEENDETK